MFGVTPGDVVYDIETYPNIFTFYAVHAKTGKEWYFEISQWRHDVSELIEFMDILRQQQCRMVGFNNIGFDYPILHFIYKKFYRITVGDIYQKAMDIIANMSISDEMSLTDNQKFAYIIKDSERIVEQIDLFKIHHFDNRARSTSLKALEFSMRSDNIEDLPFPVGSVLTLDQVLVLRRYNRHDVMETLKFYHHSLDHIRFREELTKKYQRNFMNHNDTKIGKDYFIMRLEERNPGCCYQYTNYKRFVKQTKRDYIVLADVILPYITFREPEFNRILNWFRSQTINETKGVFNDVHCVINDFRFDFGTGGIHGSIESRIVRSDENHVIIDFDVASYYPNLAIVNKFYPDHLGLDFCTIYEDVYQQRKSYAKGTAENAMLKLALNGVFGDSNNIYSPFYDPQYTMSITINGQLLLCMLAESLMSVDNIQIIQINTDGVTVRCPRILVDRVNQIKNDWEQLTGLQLETAEYKMMVIKTVNDYIAEYPNGKLKRKGSYEYVMGWHQNPSALVVPKAAEAALIHRQDIRLFINNHTDYMDFMIRAKVPRSSSLEWGGEKVANIARYYISTNGKPLEKVMPPPSPGKAGQYKKKNGITTQYYHKILAEIGDDWDDRIHTKNKSKYALRRTGINSGWLVTLCNDITDIHSIKDMTGLNYDWYVKEAEKLVLPLQEMQEGR